jgi:protein-tyrosine phosphatase
MISLPLNQERGKREFSTFRKLVLQLTTMKSKLLFLCTGNYYRSRFAEALFNHLAEKAGLDWVAGSRGLAVELGSGNIGPISKQALEGLRARAVELGSELPFPLQCQEQDLAGANLIVALDGEEHRPYVTQKFPNWLDRMEYWAVPDLYALTAQEALARIEQEVQTLVQRLASQPPAGSDQSH